MWGIEYVLFVGDYATVPMRICYPDSSFHVYDPGNPGLVAPGTPTDYYYADLSYDDDVSWDLDGDGYPGEYNQDMPDFMPEVYIGRIPVNNPYRITYTLDRTVAFEQDTGDWKSNVLHPASILFFENQYWSGYPFVDGATLIDSIETGLMSGYDITHMSEQWGIVTSPFPWPPISEAAFSGHWRDGQHAVVNWAGHGWPNGAARTVWAWDDGDGVPESGELQSIMFIDVATTDLDDDHPSVVFAISCDVGYPEPNAWGNCGIKLLTDPAWGASIGIVSASRPAAVSGEWKEEPGGTEQICYEFNRYLIEQGARVGNALYDGKYDATTVYGWPLVYEYMNLYNFNLYGDPSLELSGVETGIEGGAGSPEGVALLPCEPNPFGSGTSLVLVMPCAAPVEAMVLDLAGRRVCDLGSAVYEAGQHTLTWDGTDADGNGVANGLYFAIVRTGALHSVRSMVLIR